MILNVKQIMRMIWNAMRAELTVVMSVVVEWIEVPQLDQRSTTDDRSV